MILKGIRTVVSVLVLYAFSMVYVAKPAHSYSASLSQQDFSKMYYFAAKGDVRSLSSAISRGLNINATNMQGDTGLCVAVRNKNITAYRTFRAVGANPRPDCSWRIAHFDQFVNSIQTRHTPYYANQRPVSTPATSYSPKASKLGETISDDSNSLYWIGGIALVGGGVALAAGGGGGGGSSGGGETPPLPEPEPGLNCSLEENICEAECVVELGLQTCAEGAICYGKTVCGNKCDGQCGSLVSDTPFAISSNEDISNDKSISIENTDSTATWGGIYSKQKSITNSGDITLIGDSEAVGIMSAATANLDSARQNTITTAGGDITNSGDITITANNSVGIFATTLGTIEEGVLTSLGTITNNGDITMTGTSNIGIQLIGHGEIINSGNISADYRGIVQSNGDVGYTTNLHSNIINSGTISASDGNYAIYATNADIKNTGTIIGYISTLGKLTNSTTNATISALDDGASIKASAITNYGVIGSEGQAFSSIEATGDITNIGKIWGDITQSESIINSGSITGDITTINSGTLYNVAGATISAPDDDASISVSAITNYGVIGNEDQAFSSILATYDITNIGKIWGDINQSKIITNLGFINGNITQSESITNSGSITGDITQSESITNSGSITGDINQSESITNSGAIAGKIINTNGELRNNSGATINAAGTDGTITAGRITNNGTIGSEDQAFGSIIVTAGDGVDFNSGNDMTYDQAALYNGEADKIYGTEISVANGTVVNYGEFHGNITDSLYVLNSSIIYGNINTLSLGNTGTIISTTIEANNIINQGSGKIEGDIDTEDLYLLNSGEIIGNITSTSGQINNKGEIIGNITSTSGQINNKSVISGNVNTTGTLTNNTGAFIYAAAGPDRSITAGKIYNEGTIGSSDNPFTTITVTGENGRGFDRDDSETYTQAALYNATSGTIYGTTISVAVGTVVNDGVIYGNVVPSNNIIDNGTISPAAAQAFALMKSARFINNGTVSQSTEMNFDEMGDGSGEVHFGKDAVFEAPTVKGTAIATADHTTGSNEDSYTSSGNFVGDEVAVNVKSGTAMFSARANGSGVTMERIAFSDLLQDKELAEYLETNYQSDNRVDMFDELKQANDNNSLYDAARKALGQDFFPLLALQNQQRVRHFNHTMEDLVLDDDTLKSERIVAKFDSNYTEQDASQGMPGYEDKVYGVSGLFDKEVSKNYRFGIGMGFYNAYAEFDDDDTRRDVIVQAYQSNRFDYAQWGALIMPFAGYSRGEYKHYANGGKYEPHFNIWNVGINSRAYLKQDLGNWNFEPTLELNVSNIYQDKIKEDKNITIKGVNSLSAEAGVGAYAKRKFDLGEDGNLEVKAGAMYYRELNNKAYDSVSAQMYGMDGNYHISGYENDRNRTSLSLKADYKIGKWSVYGEVSQNFADNDNTVYNAGIRLAF